MAGLLYAGFDYGATANLPGIWTSASAVTIIPPPGGRYGGGCAQFNAAVPSELTADRTWTGTTAEKAVAICGFDVSIVEELAGDVTLAQFLTSGTTIAIIGQNTGAVVVRQDGQDVCEGGPGLFGVGVHGYLELRVDLLNELVILRCNGLPLVTAALPISTAGDTFATFVLGGGTARSGRFDIDDVYLLDGQLVNPISIGSRVIDNASFLGNIVVQALFPTADAYHGTSDSGFTPWTPASGSTHYTQVNENPPDGGITNESTAVVGTYNTTSNTIDNYDTFQTTNPQQATPGFGLMPLAQTYWPIFAVHVVQAFQVDAAHDANATVRVVGDFPSTDKVYLGADLHPTDQNYVYIGTIFDRDPSR